MILHKLQKWHRQKIDMTKKLDELKQSEYKDPNSPESQTFLRDLQQKIVAHREKMQNIYQGWVEEDRRNENK